MKILKNVCCLALVSASFACSSGGSAVDIGESRTGQKLQDYADTWEGYVEAYKFADGSDKVRVSLDAEGNGTLEVGDSAALPTATDPDVGYPASFTGNPSELSGLFPGVSYPIKSAAVQSARIQFVVNPLEVEHDWCALQTSYPVTVGGEADYRCVQELKFALPFFTNCTVNDGGSEVAVDCMKLALCTGPNTQACTCTSSGCTVYENPAGVTGNYTQLDAALADAGESLIGTVLIGTEPGQRINVRLTRQ